MIKSSLSQLPALNDDEIKRIMSVIERDFKLRQKEFKRIEELKNVIRQQEDEHVEYLAKSKEFNYERCIRCYKPFKRFFNPKEICSKCKLYVCHDCATFNRLTKTWTCKICLTIKELECFTGDWFYVEISKKYKRCGSAKVISALHKRENELANIDELDEDFGYGTLPTNNSTDSKDSGSNVSYVIHDTKIKSELNEYSKRLALLVDNLQSDLSESNTFNKYLSMRIKHKEKLKNHQQQIASEINRARTALSGPIRRSNLAYENYLRNLLIEKTAEILQTSLQEFQKTFTTQNSTNFDQNLAQVILDKCTNKEIDYSTSRIIDSPPTFSQVSAKLQRESSAPSPVRTSSFQLTRNNSLPQTTNTSWKSGNDIFQRTNLLTTSTVDEEDNEDDEEERTPTGSSIDDERFVNHDHNRRFIYTDLETIEKSNERVDGWKTNSIVIQSKAVPSSSDDDDEQLEASTWL